MARSFNGSSDYIPITTAAIPRQPSVPFSVGAWIYQVGRGSIGSTIIEVGLGGVGGFALDVGSGSDSTKLTFVKLGIAEITGGLVVPTGRWVFVGAVMLSTKIHFVMVDNGVLSTNDVSNSSALNNDTNGESQIGAARGNTGAIDTHYYWNGRIQDVFFVTRQLGDEEWRALGMGQPISTVTMNDHWPLTGRDNCEIEIGGMPSYGTLVGTSPSPDVAPRGGIYRQRSWRDQAVPLLRGTTVSATPISSADTASLSEGAPSIAATVTGSDSAAEAEGTPKIALSASDSAVVTDASGGVVSSAPTAKSDADSATVTDAVATASNIDFDVFHLTESGSIVASTPTAKSDSDSATEAETGVVTPSTGIVSSDAATLADAGVVAVVGPADLNDHDASVLSELYSLLVSVASSDSAALSQNDGGPPGGGGAGDGGGTGSGGGVGIKVKFGRRSLAAHF